MLKFYRWVRYYNTFRTIIWTFLWKFLAHSVISMMKNILRKWPWRKLTSRVKTSNICYQSTFCHDMLTCFCTNVVIRIEILTTPISVFRIHLPLPPPFVLLFSFSVSIINFISLSRLLIFIISYNARKEGTWVFWISFIQIWKWHTVIHLILF